MASEVIRAFLALPLAPFFESEVRPLLEKLKGQCPGVRWVEASKIHVTLHFFGSIYPEEVSKISRIVGPIVSQAKSSEVFLKDLGGFPNLSRPRVLWLGIEGDLENLKNVHRLLEKELEKNGFPIENRPFKPHLTLGRVKDAGKFSGISEIQFDPTPVKKIQEIVLFKSHLAPQGSHYEAIETYPFSAS